MEWEDPCAEPICLVEQSLNPAISRLLATAEHMNLVKQKKVHLAAEVLAVCRQDRQTISLFRSVFLVPPLAEATLSLHAHPHLRQPLASHGSAKTRAGSNHTPLTLAS